MIYVIGAYWPFVLIAVVLGAAVGWWHEDRRQPDEITAWLEDGPDQP